MTAESKVLPSCVLILLWIFTATGVEAQERQGRFRVGPWGVTPQIGVTNLGIDTNVFNLDQRPQQDVTALLHTTLQSWLTLGRTRLTARNGVGYSYFRTYASQRSLNASNGFRWEIPLNRFLPHVAYSHTRVRERPNQEVDVRVEQRLTNMMVGTAVRIAPRTSIVLDVMRDRTIYGDDDPLLGTTLSRSLNRTTDTVSAQGRYELTALTTLTLGTDFQRERFDLSPGRDTKSYAVTPGLEFAPTALIKGMATVSYRRFDIGIPIVPDFSGIGASVDLSYTLQGATRFSVRARRGPVHSYSDIQPYYVQTGIGASVTRRLTSVSDVMVGVSKDWLHYRVAAPSPRGLSATTAPGSLPTASQQYSADAGIHYQLGRIGLSVNVSYTGRTDGLLGDYTGTRAFTSISYEP